MTGAVQGQTVAFRRLLWLTIVTLKYGLNTLQNVSVYQWTIELQEERFKVGFEAYLSI